MKRKDVDYRWLFLNRYYWLERHQMECKTYFNSYLRLNREMCKLDDEYVSRWIEEYEDIWW